MRSFNCFFFYESVLNPFLFIRWRSDQRGVPHLDARHHLRQIESGGQSPVWNFCRVNCKLLLMLFPVCLEPGHVKPTISEGNRNLQLRACASLILYAWWPSILKRLSTLLPNAGSPFPNFGSSTFRSTLQSLQTWWQFAAKQGLC